MPTPPSEYNKALEAVKAGVATAKQSEIVAGMASVAGSKGNDARRAFGS